MKTPQDKPAPAPISEDEILRRMLNTPPKQHADSKAVPAKKPTPKKSSP